VALGISQLLERESHQEASFRCLPQVSLFLPILLFLSFFIIILEGEARSFFSLSKNNSNSLFLFLTNKFPF
jgi:hypothetical protein